jgi:hypothetical protein
LIFLKAASAVIKEFPKASRTHINGLLIAAGDFIKNFAKILSPQLLPEVF